MTVDVCPGGICDGSGLVQVLRVRHRPNCRPIRCRCPERLTPFPCPACEKAALGEDLPS